jgi:hypothetical protein
MEETAAIFAPSVRVSRKPARRATPLILSILTVEEELGEDRLRPGDAILLSHLPRV